MNHQEVFLRLEDKGSSQSALLTVSREFTERLSREPNMMALLSESPGPRGSKGDPITIGAIVLSMVGSRGVISSLLGILKSYVERKPTLAFEFQRGDAKLTVRAENLEPKQLDKTTQALRRLIGSGE